MYNFSFTDPIIKKKLPDMRMIIDNPEIFRISISIIFYSIYYSNVGDPQKLSEYLANIFENVYKLNVNQLVSSLYSINSPVAHDKEYSYTNIIDSIKNKNTDPNEIEKFYNIDNLAKLISLPSEKDSKINTLISSGSSTSNNQNTDNNSEISLTPSLQSQDTGKTFKSIVIREEQYNKEDKQSLFLPVKAKNHTLFYGNENFFVFVRYIFCIYERFNKVYIIYL